MLIPSILFSLILATQLAILFYILRLGKKIKATEKNNQLRFQKSMDRVVALDTKPKPVQSPNQALEQEEESTLLDENVPWEIPSDVKITVEGGDTLVPPGFEAI